MKIVAHLGVLDEVELIAQAVEHLYRIGVDHVIAFDMGSRDGTIEVLETYPQATLTLERLSPATPWDELHYRTVNSIQRTGAEWVLLLDADEFWLPVTGSLLDCLPTTHDLATVDRFNVVLTASGPAVPETIDPQSYTEILLYTRRRENFREHLESHPETPWISGVPVAKVLARRQCLDSIVMGGHDVRLSKAGPKRRTRSTEVVIAHLPFSTPERFQKRVANIAEFFELHPDYFSGSQGWHWRRLLELQKRGEVEHEFQRQIVSRQRLVELIADSTVRTAEDILGPAGAD